MVDVPKQTIAPEELVALGEKIYLERREELEKEHHGKFAVIEVQSREIFIDQDKLQAIQKAQEKYPDKLFFLVQVGNLKEQSTSELDEIRKYGWSF